MSFIKNETLINNICLVQIKSVDNTIDLPQLTTVYHTPSKITYTQNTKLKRSGSEIKKTLSLFYPGLSTLDFDKFNNLTKGAYQVYIKLDNNDIYEVASDYAFMVCATSFNIKTGHKLTFTTTTSIPIKFRDTQPEEGINIDGFDYNFDFYLS